jgi:hypothetical protein
MRAVHRALVVGVTQECRNSSSAILPCKRQHASLRIKSAEQSNARTNALTHPHITFKELSLLRGETSPHSGPRGTCLARNHVMVKEKVRGIPAVACLSHDIVNKETIYDVPAFVKFWMAAQCYSYLSCTRVFLAESQNCCESRHYELRAYT